MLPKVVIVGRPNVGKSSLLNALAGKRIAIVDPTAGVTRDRNGAVVELKGTDPAATPRAVELIDTGGYGIEDVQNLTAEVEQQIAHAIAEADLILFVIDAQTGIVPLDQAVARLLRTGGVRAPVVLVANKVDGENIEANAWEAMELGFGEPVMVSAINKRNRRELIDIIRDRIDFDALEGGGSTPETGPLLAIVGKRNAGKSTLVNALAGQPRVIVSEQEGTTRDSVDVRIALGEHRFTAIDTAGVRHPKSLDGDIEYYSHHRSLRSVRRADVVIFMVDATVPTSTVDRKLAQEILRHFKPTVIVVNKWDLVGDDQTQEAYIEYLDKALQGLDFAPVVFASAALNDGVREIVAMAMNLHAQAGHRVSTSELNQIIEQIVAERTPSSPGGKLPKIYYATQLDVHPPTIGLFVNDPSMFEGNYERFLMNRFRETLPFAEVPIKLLIRARNRSPKDPAGAE